MSACRVLPVLAACLVVVGVAAPASADPLQDARARAEVLSQQVTDLGDRTDTAVEEYDGAQAALAATVTARFSADEALDSARRQDVASQDVRTARVRTLYELGGPVALYGSVLDATSPTDVLQGVQMAQRLLIVDAQSAASDARAGKDLSRAAHAADAAARAQVQQTQRVATLVTQVQGLLAQQQALLASANADVVRLAQQQQQAQERAAQAAFAAELARARSAADPSWAALSAGGLPLGPTAAPSARAATVIAAARAQLGKPYVWGATGPDSFDCSGLTGWAYAAAGVRLPRVAVDQWSSGPHPDLAGLQPGDLLFWGSDVSPSPSTIHHVAIYLGAGMMIAAPHTGTVVQVQPVYATGLVGATRPS